MTEEVGVVGLGHFGGGLGLTRELLRRGHKVRLFERQPADTFKEAFEALSPWQQSITFFSGDHQLLDFEGLSKVYLNPAIPWQGDLAQSLRDRGVSLSSDLELFLSQCTLPVIAITGTNGKSTCWEFLTRLLPDWSGGGNRGISPFDLDTQDKAGIILELSSFQLERLEHRFTRAVVTNFSPDHLDYHSSFEAYRQAKQRVTSFQQKEDLCILGPGLEGWLVPGRSLILGQEIVWQKNELTLPGDFTLNFDAFPLSGQHNHDLMALSLAVAQDVLLDNDLLKSRFIDFCYQGFEPLPHRQNILFQDSITIVDDSKSTTPESTSCAVTAFHSSEGCLHLICGGVDKGLNLKALVDQLAKLHVRIYVIGEQGATWQKVASESSLSIEVCGHLEQAVQAIASCVTSGDVVLLSPGTSSYDQFRDYRQRGDSFKELAKKYLM